MNQGKNEWLATLIKMEEDRSTRNHVMKNDQSQNPWADELERLNEKDRRRKESEEEQERSGKNLDRATCLNEIMYRMYQAINRIMEMPFRRCRKNEEDERHTRQQEEMYKKLQELWEY